MFVYATFINGIACGLISDNRPTFDWLFVFICHLAFDCNRHFGMVGVDVFGVANHLAEVEARQCGSAEP